MAGRHPAAMRPRDTRAHPVLQDALDRGHLDTMTEYEVDGLNGHDAANDARMSVRRAGAHFNIAVACWVVDANGKPCRRCTPGTGPHGIRFRIHSKDKARAHITAETGGDPTKLRYNPFAGPKSPTYDDSGAKTGG